ncbi:hypothetical protein T10_3763 [Trichinella papuae]|uniref:Uncharacterized protein n=1 Tax=Trichinella papuae TaxID=268474 RepID=A0A0V1MFX7_9BILA|nr:hypothetical protein T10_3763 [Trichinella papuae]
MPCSKPSVVTGQSNYYFGLQSEVCGIFVSEETPMQVNVWERSSYGIEDAISKSQEMLLGFASGTPYQTAGHMCFSSCLAASVQHWMHAFQCFTEYDIYLAIQRWR